MQSIGNIVYIKNESKYNLMENFTIQGYMNPKNLMENLHNGTRSVTVQAQYGTPNQENNVHLRFYITPVPFCGGATQRYRRNQKNNVHLP